MAIAPARSLLLSGLVMLVLLAQAGIGSFALWRSQGEQAAARETLAALAGRLDTARLAEVAFKVQVQEWKNILLRGQDPALRQRHELAFAEERSRVGAALTRLGPTSGALRQAHDVVDAVYANALAAAQLDTGEGARAADASVRGVDRAFQQQLETFAANLLAEHATAITAASRAAQAHYRQLTLLLNVSAGVGLLLALGLLFLVIRR